MSSTWCFYYICWINPKTTTISTANVDHIFWCWCSFGVAGQHNNPFWFCVCVVFFSSCCCCYLLLSYAYKEKVHTIMEIKASDWIIWYQKQLLLSHSHLALALALLSSSVSNQFSQNTITNSIGTASRSLFLANPSLLFAPSCSLPHPSTVPEVVPHNFTACAMCILFTCLLPPNILRNVSTLSDALLMYYICLCICFYIYLVWIIIC